MFSERKGRLLFTMLTQSGDCFKLMRKHKPTEYFLVINFDLICNYNIELSYFTLLPTVSVWGVIEFMSSKVLLYAVMYGTPQFGIDLKYFQTIKYMADSTLADSLPFDIH